MKPKIYFTAKNGKTVRMYRNPSTKRISFVLGTGKFTDFVFIVDYGKGFTNEIRGTKEDIKWALTAFMDKFLWIK